MNTHELKCYPKFFEDIAKGLKSFDVREDDRGFEPGDELFLSEWDPWQRAYTGRALRAFISYILELDDVPGLTVHGRWKVLGLVHIAPARRQVPSCAPERMP